MPTDGEYVVDSVPDPNTFTVLTSTANAPSTTSRNGMWMFPLVTQPVSRNGNVSKLSSTYQLNNTDADIDQAPLNADTVFNFYLPDYKFPGLLASQGITTPEFQTTAETTVVRQSNFFFNGIFNPADTNGISSFRTGQHALVLDFSHWTVDDATNVGLGAPVSSTVPWTHNQNIARFIDHMSVLLTADQLSASAKTLIRNFVSMPITSISTGNPCTVTTATAHKYTTGDLVCISGLSSTDAQNGTFSPSNAFVSSTTARAITVTGANTFTGPATIASGTLVLGNSAALSGAAYSTDNAGTLSFGSLSAASGSDPVQTAAAVVLHPGVGRSDPFDLHRHLDGGHGQSLETQRPLDARARCRPAGGPGPAAVLRRP
jgi:autotransporter-associated beta strand protein